MRCQTNAAGIERVGYQTVGEQTVGCPMSRLFCETWGDRVLPISRFEILMGCVGAGLPFAIFERWVTRNFRPNRCAPGVSGARSLGAPAQIDLSRHQVRMQTVLSGTVLLE
jgi:hypothetical protein